MTHYQGTEPHFDFLYEIKETIHLSLQQSDLVGCSLADYIILLYIQRTSY